MAFVSRYPTRLLTVLAQDPSVVKDGKVLTIQVPVPQESLAPGPRGHRIHVVDFDATRNLFFPPSGEDPAIDRYESWTDSERFVGDRHFHAQNVYALAATTLLRFEAALGRHVTWGFPSGAHHIKIAPHAFAEANAYYSRRDEGIVFGYLPAADGQGTGSAGGMVYTALSADIVTHETTHAILDGLRGELMRPSTPDQPAFHEGFADIVALLSGLARPMLIGLVLDETTLGARSVVKMEALTKQALSDGVLLGLAEQFGQALSQRQLATVRGDALRRSVTLDPKSTSYPKLVEAGAEAHELGELLVAALMNAFLDIWVERAGHLDPTGSGFADRDSAIEEGAKSADHLLQIAIRALDYIPPTNVTFRDYLAALLTADNELVPDDSDHHYRTHIRASFALFGIETPERASPEGWWQPPELPSGRDLDYSYAGHAEMRWDREAVMRFLWENSSLLGVDHDPLTSVNSVRPVLRFGPDGFLLRETVAEYFQLLDVTGRDLCGLGLRKPDGMPDSAPVRLLGGGTLVFDDYGRLKFHIGTGVLSKSQTERVASLWGYDDDHAGGRRFDQLHRMRAIGGGVHLRAGW